MQLVAAIGAQMSTAKPLCASSPLLCVTTGFDHDGGGEADAVHRVGHGRLCWKQERDTHIPCDGNAVGSVARRPVKRWEADMPARKLAGTQFRQRYERLGGSQEWFQPYSDEC